MVIAIPITAKPTLPIVCIIPLRDASPILLPVTLSSNNLAALLSKELLISTKTGANINMIPPTARAVNNCTGATVGITLKIPAAATKAAAIVTIANPAPIP